MITASRCGTGSLNLHTLLKTITDSNFWGWQPKHNTYTLICTCWAWTTWTHDIVLLHSLRELGVKLPLREYRQSSSSSFLMHTLTWHCSRQSDALNDTCEVTTESALGHSSLPDWVKDSAGQVTLKCGLAVAYFDHQTCSIASLGCCHLKVQSNWSRSLWYSPQFMDNASSLFTVERRHH